MKSKFVIVLALLVVIVVSLFMDNQLNVGIPENFIPVDPKCGDLHGPVWIDNSCWMDSSFIALFGPEQSRSYFYQFLEPQHTDDNELKKIKKKIQHKWLQFVQ